MTLESFGAVIANHLWQSTAFTGLAALFALLLRKNHAATRHRIWAVASLKFLVPFSLLAGLGNRLSWLAPHPAATVGAQPIFTGLVEQIGLPFTRPPAMSVLSHTAPLQYTANLWALVLLAIWICGFIAVASSWWFRWRRIRVAVQSASPIEVDVAAPVLSSPAMIEPGVFGIFRPVLLLPEGIVDRLSGEHLHAILAHELCHIRRRDNLMAALHMIVEAIFWFYPLVWWLGARLVAERERACDEEVVRLHRQPDVYAESILKTCEFYFESPLPCMSGIAGADLKERITRIMTKIPSVELTIGRKLLLALAGTVALTGPIVFGLLNAPRGLAQSPAPAAASRPSFEVISIKPNKGNSEGVMIRMAPGGRFEAHNITLKFLVEEAYHVKDNQVSGAPGWFDSEHFDIEAKPEDSFAGNEQKLDQEARRTQMMLMLQGMLEERFKLAIHHESKDLPVYALLVAKNGPKLHESAPSAAADTAPPGPLKPDGPQPRHSIRMMGRGDLTINSTNLDTFAEVLSRQLGRLVVNKTGLKGEYDFTLKWTPDDSERGGFGGPPGGPDGHAAPPPDAGGPSLFAALQEQLGLRIESQKGPVDTIVIDHVEKPSEN